MLPYYNTKRKPLTRWERFTSWLEDAEPYIVTDCGGFEKFSMWGLIRAKE